MKNSKGLTKTDLWFYGFVIPPTYDFKTHEWHIRRITKRGRVDQKIFDVKTKHKYAPTSVRKVINIGYGGRNISIPLAKFIYVFFVEDLADNEYACINENLENPYWWEYITKKTKEELEAHKNKGNQYFSEKWNILPKN